VRSLPALGLATILLLAACSDDGAPGPTTTSSTSSDGSTTTVTPTTAVAAGPVPSAGCDAAAVPPGTTDRRLRSGGRSRSYQLVVPQGYDGTEPLPLVLSLHALTVDYAVTPSLYGLLDAAVEDPVVIAAPSGLVSAGTPYWLAAPAVPNDDVDFIVDLLDQLEAELCLDTERVFSTGQSNGGQMSSLLACRLGDRITAVAPVAGVEFSDDECTGPPVPVMAFHGDADPIVRYDGGGLNATAIADQQRWHGDGPDGLPVHGGVDQAMADWAAHNGCDPEPVEDQVSPEVLRRTWAGCDAATVLYVVQGGGHTWPGHPVAGFEDQFGPTTTDIDATALMFDFFLR
jgi:polyhydroxybutyrate depolymerase